MADPGLQFVAGIDVVVAHLDHPISIDQPNQVAGEDRAARVGGGHDMPLL